MSILVQFPQSRQFLQVLDNPKTPSHYPNECFQRHLKLSSLLSSLVVTSVSFYKVHCAWGF